jgi:serine/threonine protein kinase
LRYNWDKATESETGDMLQIGDKVGQYEVISPVGQGGMASVYKAYHESLDRYVAIKVMHQAFLQDESFRTRFAREARIVARLDHPNIVPRLERIQRPALSRHEIY